MGLDAISVLVTKEKGTAVCVLSIARLCVYICSAARSCARPGQVVYSGNHAWKMILAKEEMSLWSACLTQGKPVVGNTVEDWRSELQNDVGAFWPLNGNHKKNVLTEPDRKFCQIYDSNNSPVKLWSIRDLLYWLNYWVLICNTGLSWWIRLQWINF